MIATLGEVAYEAYCASVGWVSVRGEQLPAYADQDERIRDAWETAAGAVRSAVLRGQEAM